jgi:hypothetical protein
MGVVVVKRLFLLTLCFVSILMLPFHAYGKIGFKDVQDIDWFYETVTSLCEAGVINGFPTGDFRPNEPINVDAFIKMTVTVLGYTDIKNGPFYWAKPYIDKAMELGLVKEGEFSSYARPIYRNEMARIVVRALDDEYPDNLQAYKSLITDYNAIYSRYQDYVLKAYCKGILTGYADGSFRGENTATRAEAATIIYRLIEPSARKVPKLPVHPYDELLLTLMDDEAFFEYFENKERFPEYEFFCTASIDRENRRFMFFDRWRNIKGFVPAENTITNLNRKLYSTAKVFTTDNTSFIVAMINIGDSNIGNAVSPELVLLRYGWKPGDVADFDPYYYFEYKIFSKDLQTRWDGMYENLFMELAIKSLYSPDDNPIYGDADGLIFQRHVDKLRKSLITLFEYDYSEELFNFILNEYKEGLKKDMKRYHETGESDYYIRNPIYNSFDFGNIRAYTMFANYLYVFFTYR